VLAVVGYRIVNYWLPLLPGAVAYLRLRLSPARPGRAKPPAPPVAKPPATPAEKPAARPAAKPPASPGG